VRVLIVAGVHFVLAFVAAVVAYGWDLDRIPRSGISSAAATLHAILMWPHNAFIGHIPSEWLLRIEPLPGAAVFVNSIFWGVGLFVLWRLLRIAQQRVRRVQA
jgi:hypothetical protein